MKVLVTGATGFLGSHLVDQLIEAGHHVRALVRATSKTDHLRRVGAEIVHASLETGERLDQAVSGVDAVVHGAAIVRAKTPAEFHRINTGGTEKLVDAVRTHQPNIQRFVYVSSLAAHGFGENGGPRPSDAEPAPVTHYGRSKLAGERVVLAAKDEFPVTVIRPPAIYGPRDSEMFAFFQIVSRRVVPFLGSADNQLSLVFARDCAQAIVLALTKPHPSGRVYWVEDGQVYTQRQFVHFIEDALGKRAILKLPVPIQLVSVAAVGSEAWGRLTDRAMMLTRDKVHELRAEQVCCPADEIRRELGWEPQTQLSEGARASVQWYRQEGWL